MNKIGLKNEYATDLAKDLNELLANYQIFYMNVRGFHWNIKGEKFFELHLKFEELYNSLLLKVDEVAERILTLGSAPVHSFSEYITLSKIAEAHNISDGRTAVKEILDSIEGILKLQREILKKSADAGDEGSLSLMSDYIREQEKLVWMYQAFLG